MASRNEAYWKHRFQTVVRIMEAVEMLKKGVSTNQVATIFGVSNSTVSVWKREYYEKRKYTEVSKFWNPSLDGTLVKWYLSRIKEGEYVTRKMIQLKAKEINFKMLGNDNFVPGMGWVTQWKKKHGFDMKKVNSSRKPSQQVPILPQPCIDKANQNEQQRSQYHHSLPTITQNLPKSLNSIDLSHSFEKYNKSPTIQKLAQEGHSLNRLGEQELEDDDEIVKELDNMLSGFQQKIINSNKKSDEDCYKRNRNNDNDEPKAKMLITENQVAKTLLDRSFPATMKDIFPEKNSLNYAEMVVKQEKNYDGVTNIGEAAETEESSEENTQTDNEGEISYEEEYRNDDSETSSLTSVIESFDEEEELKDVKKIDDRMIDIIMTSEESCISTNSSSLAQVLEVNNKNKKHSGIEVSDSELENSKNIESLEEPVLEIDISPDDNKDDVDKKIVEKERTEISNSAVSVSQEYHVILIDSSSGEDSDEEIINNENEESDDDDDNDDDVILIENKSETIVIETSDSEEEEKNYQEEPIHQHSQFKIILLNTKEGDKEFSIVDAETLETEPTVVLFDKE